MRQIRILQDADSPSAKIRFQVDGKGSTISAGVPDSIDLVRAKILDQKRFSTSVIARVEVIVELQPLVRTEKLNMFQSPRRIKALTLHVKVNIIVRRAPVIIDFPKKKNEGFFYKLFYSKKNTATRELGRLLERGRKQKRPAMLRGVWSGKRDSNYFS